jgi:tetratricopeptide (TPR) repeat protein
MSRHPFAGRHPERAIRVETAIREGLFAFGQEAARQGWQPPPFSLRLTDLPSSVAQLFDRAFGTDAASGGPRPTAADWITSLDELEAMAGICSQDPRHVHVKANGSCPWCRIEKEGGPFFFLLPAGRQAVAPPPDMQKAFDEIESYVALGFVDDARDALSEIASKYPGHPALAPKLAELGLPGGARAADQPTLTALYDTLYTCGESAVSELGDASLADIFKEFKKGVDKQLGKEDYDTRYNLGVAYKEMGLIDEAIAQFQLAAKDEGRLLKCSSMLGVCFLEKGMAKLAVKWFEKGLSAPGRTEKEYQGLRYDLATALEAAGETDKARTLFTDLSGQDANFPAEHTPSPVERELFMRLGGLMIKIRSSFGAVENKLTVQEREQVLNAIDGFRTLTSGEVEELRRCVEALERALPLLEKARSRP